MFDVILLAVGDRGVRRRLESLTHDSGLRHVSTGGGEATLQQLQRLCPTLLVVDMRLADMDGCRLIESLRADRRFSQTPILAILDDDAAGRFDQVTIAGANDFLCAPFSDGEALARIRNALTRTNAVARAA